MGKGGIAPPHVEAMQHELAMNPQLRAQRREAFERDAQLERERESRRRDAEWAQEQRNIAARREAKERAKREAREKRQAWLQAVRQALEVGAVLGAGLPDASVRALAAAGARDAAGVAQLTASALGDVAAAAAVTWLRAQGNSGLPAPPEPGLETEPEEGEPGVKITVRGITGDTTVLENVHPAETSVRALMALCAKRGGGDPKLLRLVSGGVPLDDSERTLAKYGIVREAELSVVAQTLQEAKERDADAGQPVLRAALNMHVASWMRAAAESCGTSRMKLRNANGSYKHRRWVRLTVECTSELSRPPKLHLCWGKHEDHSQQFQWKHLGWQPPKQRVLTGLRDESLASNPLGFTAETEEGDVLFATEGPY